MSDRSERRNRGVTTCASLFVQLSGCSAIVAPVPALSGDPNVLVR